MDYIYKNYNIPGKFTALGIFPGICTSLAINRTNADVSHNCLVSGANMETDQEVYYGDLELY